MGGCGCGGGGGFVVGRIFKEFCGMNDKWVALIRCGNGVWYGMWTVDGSDSRERMGQVEKC